MQAEKWFLYSSHICVAFSETSEAQTQLLPLQRSTTSKVAIVHEAGKYLVNRQIVSKH